jgi:acetylornithine deacetylase/succinyl-diaminopimelate desuccinylase-like protein
MNSVDILSEVRAICARESFRRRLTGFLCGICEVDTTPAQELLLLRKGEQRVFQLIRAGLADLGLSGGSAVWKAISPAIRDHSAFSQPYYAPDPAAAVYRERGNLLYFLDREPAEGGRGVALNAHIDTVAPFFGPASSGDVISGRGAADDKGNVAVILGALHVLDELEQRRLVALKNRLTALFVIDEETGGNGSLDLALDRRLKERYGSLLVLECTGNQLHPANRGAVFIRCDGRLSHGSSQDSGALRAPDGKEKAASPVMLSGLDTRHAPRQVTSEASHAGGPSSDPGEKLLPSLGEAYAFAILELLEEGEAIRRESDHPLFPHRPVQTCTGILGSFGVHPSAICAEVSLELSGPGLPGEPVVRDCIDSAIRSYVARHGDKTQVVDSVSGRRKVERHYDLNFHRDGRCTVAVYGAGGHMGSLPQNDAAITKWAFVVRELVERRRALGLAFHLELPHTAGAAPSTLVFEGAQGFLPTHSMEQVKARVRAAFLKGLGKYLSCEGFPQDTIVCDVTFDKLHNEAYACDVGSPTMRQALRTAVELGLVQTPVPPPQDAPGQTPNAVMQTDNPLRGWEVSCDARLFAREYPGLPVITFGAGSLEVAHSDLEEVRIPDLIEAVCFVSLFVLRETGSIS